MFKAKGVEGVKGVLNYLKKCNIGGFPNEVILKRHVWASETEENYEDDGDVEIPSIMNIAVLMTWIMWIAMKTSIKGAAEGEDGRERGCWRRGPTTHRSGRD